MSERDSNQPVHGPITLYEKILRAHTIRQEEDVSLIYIDRHLVHEVTSPQAFEGLRLAGRKVRRPDRTVATMDHNVSTRSRSLDAAGEISKAQLATLQQNCGEFGVPLFDLDNPDQGIIHIIGPELGYTLPGMTIVCGDSHTATHGAFGALAFGIGTSEVEHVLATQTLPHQRSKTMLIQCSGQLSRGVEAKDLILYIIGVLGTEGARGHVIEYAGEAIRSLSMDGRMTVCNMSIEAGAIAGMIAPDETTFAYVKGRDFAPAGETLERAIEHWRTLYSDEGASFDRVVQIDASRVRPQVTWGTNPGQVVAVDEEIPSAVTGASESEFGSESRALAYMDLRPGMQISHIPINQVFIGSCTNGRMDDLRAAAAVLSAHPERRVHEGVTAIAVPGSGRVRAQAEAEGLDKIFRAAGFEWRLPGCSLCLAMNDDVLQEGQRCASTSNRNFEGRQGRGSRTHLVSAGMAAAAALEGHFVDVRNYI